MPVFRQPFLSTRLPQKSSGGGGDYFSWTMAEAQLSILEDRLEREGQGHLNLAAYEQLIQKANKLAQRFNPNTSTGQNALANIDEYISGKNTERVIKDMDRQNSSALIKSDLDDALKRVSFESGNNPKEFINRKSKLLTDARILAEARFENAQKNDNFAAMDQFENLYNEIDAIRDDVVGMKAALESEGDIPLSFGVQVSTDASGRVTGFDYKSRSEIGGDWKATTATLEGVPVFVRPIKELGGIESVYLGGKKFSNKQPYGINDNTGSDNRDVLTVEDSADPIEPIPFKPTDFKVRGHIPDGGWARSKNGMYKNIGGYQFAKFPGTTPEQLGLRPQDYQEVNSVWESSMDQAVVQTGDLSQAIDFPEYATPAVGNLTPLQPSQTSPIEADVIRAQQESALQTGPQFKKPVSEPRPSLGERAGNIFKSTFSDFKSGVSRFFGGG